MNKKYRTSHWVGHSYLKELDTNDFFEWKQIIDDIEVELTEASKPNSKSENSTVTEEANVDEAIPIYLKKELNKKAYIKQ